MRVSPEWYAQRQAKAAAPPSVSRAPDGTVTDVLELAPTEPPAPRKSQRPVPLERDVLAASLKLLKLHPKIAWAERMNVGKFKVVDAHGERWIRAAFKGCSDIIGQLRSGAFLAVETKRPGEHPTPEQQAFLEHVKRHGGVAFVARSIDDVTRALALV